VTWRFPKEGTELTVKPDAIIAVQADLHDDYGLTKVGYGVRSAVGAREVTVETIDVPNVKKQNGGFDLDLKRFVLKAGDRVEFLLMRVIRRPSEPNRFKSRSKAAVLFLTFGTSIVSTVTSRAPTAERTP